MKLDRIGRKELSFQSVDGFIQEIRYPFKHCNPTEDKVTILLTVWIAGFVHVEEMHENIAGRGDAPTMRMTNAHFPAKITINCLIVFVNNKF
jgi:hypothetical protein